MTNIHLDALAIFFFFLIVVTTLGCFASRWQSGNLKTLAEWGIAGRRFGPVVMFFFLGSATYTASTFIAFPAATYMTGVVRGFFAVPFTALAFPIVFVVLSRFWIVCKNRGYLTTADFVQGRFGSSFLTLVIALTGILASLPYIAVQMAGIQLALSSLGIPSALVIDGRTYDLPLLAAFGILAFYTYINGLRAPALLSFIKVGMIFVVLITLLLLVPFHFHGFAPIFAAAHKKALLNQDFTDLIPAHQEIGYATLAFGSALSLFLYPHTIASVLSSHSQKIVKWCAIFVPIYSILLGVFALIGYMAIADHVPLLTGYGSNSIVPAFILHTFPAWFIGFAMAALAIMALVPASIMSLASATLFARNIYRIYIHKHASEQEETVVAKLASLCIKFGALLFLLYGNTAQLVSFQFLGGIWILQTFPAVFLGLYTRWFHPWALIVGWLAGMFLGTLLTFRSGSSSTYPLFGVPIYIAMIALLLNLLLTGLLSPVCKRFFAPYQQDLTATTDYSEAYAPDVLPETGFTTLM